MLQIALIIFCTCMFYYVIWRFFAIFHNDVKILPLIIAIILAIVVTFTFTYRWWNRFLDIIWTLSSWLFVSWFLLTILLSIENLISIRYKINPRIIIWIIIIIFWLGTYFSLSTKTTVLDIETDKITKDTKILFVSDIHVDNIMSEIHLKKLVKAINEEKPDFVIIWWDLMNKPNIDYVKHFSILDSIDTPIYAVMGNHDVMWETDAINQLVQNSKIYFLFNDAIEIDGVYLMGLIDKSIRRWWSLFNDLKSINYSKDNKLFNILISHQPIKLSKLEDYPIDLELAWHTHRGQFFWIRRLVYLMNDYWYWKYEHNEKLAFITQWIWTRWLPFRLWTQSEIVLINLIKK